MCLVKKQRRRRFHDSNQLLSTEGIIESKESSMLLSMDYEIQKNKAGSCLGDCLTSQLRITIVQNKTKLLTLLALLILLWKKLRTSARVKPFHKEKALNGGLKCIVESNISGNLALDR